MESVSARITVGPKTIPTFEACILLTWPFSTTLIEKEVEKEEEEKYDRWKGRRRRIKKQEKEEEEEEIEQKKW